MENIFDGIQRPLEAIANVSGDCFIPRGINVPSLDVVKQWEFRPSDKFKVPSRPLLPVSETAQTSLLCV
jgi:V-type H+-transporting ATPase subunit A